MADVGRTVGLLMNYNPQDPKNFAFYQTYIADDETHSPRRRPGCLTAAILLLVFIAFLAMALGW